MVISLDLLFNFTAEYKNAYQAERHQKRTHHEERHPVPALCKHRHEENGDYGAECGSRAAETCERTDALACVEVACERLDIVHGELVAAKDDSHEHDSLDGVIHESHCDEGRESEESSDDNGYLAGEIDTLALAYKVAGEPAPCQGTYCSTDIRHPCSHSYVLDVELVDIEQ